MSVLLHVNKMLLAFHIFSELDARFHMSEMSEASSFISRVSVCVYEDPHDSKQKHKLRVVGVVRSATPVRV